MKIAMLGQKGIPTAFGGIERHVEELSTRLAAKGHEVFVYCRPWYIAQVNQEIKDHTYRGVTLIATPSIKSKHFDAISHTLFSTIDALRRNPDIYHYHGVGPALLSWMPRLFRPQARVIVTFHCIDRKHQKWGLLARLSLRLGEWAACRFAHETITVSRTLEQYCHDVYERKTTYIPNGIIAHGTDECGLIRRFDLLPNQYIAMISRLVRHKGAHYLIKAWRLAREEQPELLADMKLAIVGDSAFTDEYVQELHQMASGEASIVFTGYQSGGMLDELFANALFITHPSESEGLPIAVLEAMSYGKVVLASDIPENMEIVAEYGTSFPCGDIVSLKNKIIDLIKNSQTLPELGMRAREFVLREYHWDDIACNTEALYQKTIKAAHEPIPALQ